jgi:hypothetical protein
MEMSNVVLFPGTTKGVSQENLAFLVASAQYMIKSTDDYLSNPKQLVQRHVLEDALMQLELAIIPFNEGSYATRQSTED